MIAFKSAGVGAGACAAVSVRPGKPAAGGGLEGRCATGVVGRSGKPGGGCGGGGVVGGVLGGESGGRRGGDSGRRRGGPTMLRTVTVAGVDCASRWL